jgi:hypothetical protein
MTGEKIYEYDLDVTGMTDYSVTLQTILSGQASIPPQGARIDVAFEGRASGRVASWARSRHRLSAAACRRPNRP